LFARRLFDCSAQAARVRCARFEKAARRLLVSVARGLKRSAQAARVRCARFIRSDSASRAGASAPVLGSPYGLSAPRRGRIGAVTAKFRLFSSCFQYFAALPAQHSPSRVLILSPGAQFRPHSIQQRKDSPKMSTPAQLAANLANAQASTGPRTE